MSNSGAVIGDVARFCWASGESLEGTIKHIPQDVGDTWIVWAKDLTIFHIQQFESMFVINRKGGAP